MADSNTAMKSLYITTESVLQNLSQQVNELMDMSQVDVTGMVTGGTPRVGYDPAADMMDRSSNSSANETLDLRSLHPEQSLKTELDKSVTLIVYGLMAILGVIFNTLTILVFVRGKRSSIRDIRILIINLAIADMVYSLSGPIPVALSISEVSFPDSNELCRLYRFIYIASAYGSTLANLAIALERLIIVYSPARTLRLRNRRKTMLYIIGSFWLFDFAITGEYLVSPVVRNVPGHPSFCSSNTYIGNYHAVAFSWLLVLKFCAPAFIIVIIYCIIAAKLTLCCKPVGPVSMDAHLQKQFKARNQMVKMLSMVAAVTILTWLPYNLYSLMFEYDDPLDKIYKANFYCDTILFGVQLTNGFTSPMVYFYYDRYFKRDFYELFGCSHYIKRKGGASSQFTQTSTSLKNIKAVQPQQEHQQQQQQQQEVAIENTAEGTKSTDETEIQ